MARGVLAVYWRSPYSKSVGSNRSARRARGHARSGRGHPRRDHHRGVDLARPRRPAPMAHVAHDQCPVAEGELRAVTLADLHALDKPEGRPEPLDGLAHIGVDQHGDDRGHGMERLSFTPHSRISHRDCARCRPPSSTTTRCERSSPPSQPCCRALSSGRRPAATTRSVWPSSTRSGRWRALPERGERHRPLPGRAGGRRP